jgi:hypothetical protein
VFKSRDNEIRRRTGSCNERKRKLDSRITGLAPMKATKPDAKPLTTEPTQAEKTQHVHYILYCDVTAKLLQTSFTILLHTTFFFISLNGNQRNRLSLLAGTNQ